MEIDDKEDREFIEAVECDGRPKKDRVTRWEIMALSISIFSHFCDVVFDYILAFGYLKEGKQQYFWLTLGFILFPSFINTAFSIRM